MAQYITNPLLLKIQPDILLFNKDTYTFSYIILQYSYIFWIYYNFTLQLDLLSLLYFDIPARSTVSIILLQLYLLSLLHYDRPARSTVTIIISMSRYQLTLYNNIKEEIDVVAV